MSLSDNWRRRATALPRPIAVLLHPLTIALLVGVALRALLWGNLPRTGLVSDEGEYLSAASWIAAGRGFAWYQGYLWTRAPLYPLLVAGHLRLFGDSLEPIYLTQTLLSLLNVALVYALARRLTPRTESRELSVEPPSGDTQPPGGYPALGTRLFSVPFLAALLTALYFPLAAYPQLLLSETLFISLLLGAFLALAAGMEDPRPGTGDQGPGGGARRDPLAVTGVGHAPIRSSVHGPWPGAFLVLAGALLGLATLTRSLALGFVPLAALWLLSVSHATCKMEGARRILAPALVIFACCSVFVPWAIASSRLYGGPVLVDSSGAYNLLLGARTAHDGRRKDAQVRDFALGLLGQPTADDPAGDSCTPYPGPLPTQAARQAAMTREGLCLIAARPWAFAQKTLAELIDLFQINYTGAERFTDGFTTGRLPAWYVLALFLLDDTLYVLALPLAVLGWAHYRTLNAERRRMNSGVPCFNPQPSAFSVLIALWWLYNLAAAPLLFAINRFRLPLMPFAFIFAAWALVAGARALTGRHAGARTRSRGDLRAFVASCLRGDRRVCWYVLTGTLAALLWLAAATPHAYLEPRGPGEDSRWASYLGPYPSSLAITQIALAAGPRAAADARFAAALTAGDTARAAEILRSAPVGDATARLGPALIAARAGRPDDVLRALPPQAAIDRRRDALAAVLRGDALRTLGDEAGARAAFTQRYVDEANPVEWAWKWLQPAPTRRIDLGGNLDLGYIRGCYLGEGDPAERATYRWCGGEAQLRFPGAGTGTPLRLVLRADGRGWPRDMGQPPPVRVLVDGAPVGAFTPDPAGPREFVVLLPPAPAGAEVLVTLHAATFVPGPERYLRQQSEAVLGQVQRLGVRLDWVELRNDER